MVAGYFRVLYDTPLTNLINAQLKANHTVIEALTRSQLQDDYFSAAYQSKYIMTNNLICYKNHNPEEIILGLNSKNCMNKKGIIIRSLHVLFSQ